MGEKGHALPETLLASDDFHCTNLRRLGCFAAGIGSSILETYACGDLWMRVPYCIKVERSGKLPLGVMVRDVSQKILGDIGGY